MKSLLSEQGNLLSKIATNGGRGKVSPYFDGLIQMGLAKNQLSFDLTQWWIMNNPKASICTVEEANDFKDIAIYQDYHGLPEFRNSMSRQYENDLLLAKQLIKHMEETVRYDDETSALIRECIDSLDNAIALSRKNICSTICFSDHQTFSCPLCDYVNTKRSGAKRHNHCKNCGTYWIKDDVPVARGYGKTKGYKSKESSKAAKNRKSNSENSSLTLAAATAVVASAITSTVPGLRHSLKATKAKLGDSSSNSSSAPYQEWKSEYLLTLTPDQDGTERVFHIGDESSDGSHLQSGVDATEMSTQHLVEREDMEMLADRQASSCQTACSSTNSAVQVTLFSRVKAVARWPSVLFNRARSYFTHRSDQEGDTSLQPNGSSQDLEAGNGTEMSTTPPISDGSSQDPEEGNVTDEIHQNPQSNHSPKHFGMFIFFFAVNLVLAHVRDTYNDSSSSTKANWHSYYFGGTITVSFISTLCANILAKYEKPARFLEKIGIGFGASGFIMAMVELLLPNVTWIAWIATPIVWIAVILG
ncbi:uncharacterized protein LOC132294733 [Cornus florida]|uniref:uncharacterized protein LOC132294733 n=1 Tax=Cornus florida TaxID=4283 RepID=UPI002896FF29|nr:uncharacterized protein LOC132294733 [Cornus florida]